MMNIDTIKQDIAALPPDAQQIIFDLVDILKKRYVSNPEAAIAQIKSGRGNPPVVAPIASDQNQAENLEDWSDFIGCIAAESDLSRNYKTYLSNEVDQKYDNR